MIEIKKGRKKLNRTVSHNHLENHRNYSSSCTSLLDWEENSYKDLFRGTCHLYDIKNVKSDYLRK